MRIFFNRPILRALFTTVSSIGLIGWAGMADAQQAQTDSDALAPLVLAGAQATGGPDRALLERIERMERELQTLKAELHDANETAQAAQSTAEAATKTAERARTVAAEPAIEELPDVLWHLAGYMATGLTVSDSPEQEDTFVAGQFNPMYHFQYKDLVLFEAEAEIEVEESGETNFEIEYTQADIFLHDYATLVVGKFLSPVGVFQEKLHPSWINKMPDAPAGFGHDGIQPLTDVGAQLRAGIPIGDSVLTYALGVGNGPRVSEDGGLELEGFGGDDNDNKSVFGRVSFLPVPGLEIGGSFLTAKVSGEEGTVIEPDALDPTNADFTLWGVDAAFTRGGWDARFEYLNGDRDSIVTAVPHEKHEEGALEAASISTASGGGEEEAVGETEAALLSNLDVEAWYAQLAYRLSDLTDRRVIKDFEPVVRVGEFNVQGLEELREHAAEDRFDIGLNYWLAPSAVLHTSVQWRDFEAVGRETETRFQVEFGYGF